MCCATLDGRQLSGRRFKGGSEETRVIIAESRKDFVALCEEGVCGVEERGIARVSGLLQKARDEALCFVDCPGNGFDELERDEDHATREKRFDGVGVFLETFEHIESELSGRWVGRREMHELTGYVQRIGNDA